MPSSIWDKYKLIKEINNNSNIKTYITRIEPIIKEIIPKNNDEYFLFKERIERIKEIIKIYDIIEENDKIYVVIENEKEEILKFDKLIMDECNIEKEGILEGHGNPVSKNEILELFEMEKSMCKIKFDKIENEEIKKGKGTGFFCEIENCPFKYGLFTNNHVLDENNIKLGNIINIEYLDNDKINKKEIKINKKRKVLTNKEMDYTCIELLESDNIKDYFKIDPNLFSNNKKYLKNSEIFLLQYPQGNELSFSYGKILAVKDDRILHSGSTEKGSSGSPIIKRDNIKYIIGLHYGGSKKGNKYSYNIATDFDSILNDINKTKNTSSNEINCIFINNKKEKNKNEIQLLHDYNLDISDWDEEDKKLYLDVKEINKQFFEENIDIFINGEKIKFDFKYNNNESGEIKVKFKFNKKLADMSFIFYNCSSLKSIDLSSFDTNNVTNMSGFLANCSSLESIKLKSFNTNNVINMRNMFSWCSSLESIDLTSFNTNKVINMSRMFNNCAALKSIDLSSFNTINVTNMSRMFNNCSSLESIDLSSFDTSNVTNMSGMFNRCNSLKSIGLSSFNTTNVLDMNNMFSYCCSLESLNLSSFDTSNVTNISGMFNRCNSLKSLDLSSFNTSNVINIKNIFNRCNSLEKDNIKINNKKDKILNEIKN